MIKHGTWLCPIISSFSDGAFFRPSEDKIYLPLKGQFHTGEGFYSTLLHEMAHSTGTDTRLGREMKNMFGDPKYAKEGTKLEILWGTPGTRQMKVRATVKKLPYNSEFIRNENKDVEEIPHLF